MHTIFPAFKERKQRIILIAALTGVCCYLAYYFHTVLGSDTIFTHFFYLPIILASLWWGRRGIFIAVFLAGLDLITRAVYVPHIPIFSDALRTIMFIVIAGVVAVLSERITKEEKQLEHLNLVLRAIRNVNQLVTKEKDRGKLLEGACKNLTETRGYHNTWIVLLDESGKLTEYAESGLGKDFLPMVERLKQGWLPACGQTALKQPEVVVTEDPASICTDCPLSVNYTGRGGMTVRLEHGGKVYGLLCVSVLIQLANDEEELSLFHEVARDIAFALNNIEREEQRKQAEEDLRKSEMKYSTLVEYSNDGIVILQGGSLIFTNLKILEMAGFSPEEVVGKSFIDFVSPEYRGLAADKYKRRALGEEIPDTWELELIAKDGSKIPVEISASIISYEEKPADMVIIRDISERKQAEEALKESHEKFQMVVSNITVAAWSADIGEDGAFENTYTSTVFDELLGLPVGTLKNDWNKYFSYVKPEYMERINIAFGKAIESPGTIMECECEVVKDNGQTAWLYSSGRCFENNGKLRVFGSTEDITERKIIEQDLRKSEQRFREVSDNALAWVWEIDVDGKYTYSSSTCQKILGYYPEEILQRRFYEQFYPEERERLKKEVFEVFAAKTPFRQFVTRNKHKNGRIVWLSTSGNPVLDKQGNLLGYRGVDIDITEQKKAEAEKQELERKAQVTDRLASVGEMASGIAHEINNPLTGVVGFSELLLEKDLPEDLREEVGIICDGAKRVADIVKRLLTFARQHKPEQTCTDINEIIKSTLTLRKYSLETGNIEVKTSLDAGLPFTMADVGQLQQVFMNIIVNAEVEMKKAHGRGKLTIKTEQIDNKIRLSFKDDGPGIARENLERIFDPFFTTKEVGEGTGLGLSLSHGIIAEHKGTMYVESEPGKGATFIIELPIVAEGEEKIERVETVEEAGKAIGARILVVDDEPTILAFLKKVLGAEGYDVETASSGEEALKRIGSEEYGLILCDIKLPGLSGVEIYEQIGKSAPSLQERVVFITGDVISADTREFLKRTKVPYVTKPFDIAKLKEEVKRVIAGAG